MTKKTQKIIDTTQVGILRDYCEKRWRIQDNYFDSCYTTLRRYATALFFILLICITVINVMLATKVNSLQHRVETIEQTWSE